MSQQNDNTDESAIDWDQMAEIFDRWLPFIQPVADALIDLADISEGHAVLDVAAGTGEPSLTLARRHGHQNISITGVDSAQAMVERANKKVADQGLHSLDFQHMKAENLSFENARFDRVISRFGVMLFDDPLKGLREMRRVLRPGGKMAIAVWGEFEKITSLHLIWKVLMDATPEAERPPSPRIGRLGAPGKLASLLKAAGFEKLEVRPLIVRFHFEDFEHYWKISTEGGMLKEPLDYFPIQDQKKLKKKVQNLTLPYRMPEGLLFHNDALMALATP